MAKADHPINKVHWIQLDQITANDFNPNSVAKNEMRLLYHSIKSNGYTQPVVVIWDSDQEKYVIVDGFHRYTIMRTNKDIRDSTGGELPCVVLDVDINQHMAATVRHNRARGKHSVSGMAGLIFSMLKNGMKDEEICNELGLEAEELIRHKHVTGFSKLFENARFGQAWVTDKQSKMAKDYKDANS